MRWIHRSGILDNKLHSNVMHHGLNKSFHICYITILVLSSVMRFIVANPNGAAGKCGYGSVFDIVRDAFSQKETLNFGAFFGMRVLAIVLDQELQGLPITDTGDFVELPALCLKGLVVDFYELGRQARNVSFELLRGI